MTLQAGACMDSCSYMNLFDLDAWEKYTDINEKKLLLRIKGRGKIKLVCQSGQEEKKIAAVSYDCLEQGGQRLQIEIPKEIKNGSLYFEVEADTQTCLYHAAYATQEPSRREVYLALVICTYHRKEQLERNIRRIRASGFYTDNSLKGRLMVRIVDNGQELKDEYGEGIRVYGNPNTGGSGGFSRGMDETVREKGNFPATQVILMDDDVEFMAESLYRLYALLSYEREEYRQTPVAGRMFRLDRRQVQYTAAEIWNRGDIRHIGWNQDMTQPENLTGMNENEGAEYGGWWFACYPMEFVEKNRPLPFFLHCDDVEYGLRHGGTPIILNGIQVWHETYEYRQSAVMAYYDTRNALIVNRLRNLTSNKEIIYKNWKRNITEQHLKKDYLTERMMILAMWDFLVKDINKVNVLQNHKRVLRRRYMLRVTNALVWRVTAIAYVIVI